MFPIAHLCFTFKFNQIMEKDYAVSVDITMSKIINISAESEEDAKAKVEEMFSKDPYQFRGDAYICHEITDVYDAQCLSRMVVNNFSGTNYSL